ncbi:MAG: tRNA (adenosine(37)-N6)-threonylcarbamoyltransferase complex transferase subunit TsaD [Alphaproteobacteria bacterium]|nr:tRNA (adenosine(37)-N6)-threonylcarbamoyltransferase complex transferase subunit TsaD [Alphaproteobacteria bacterium]
MNVLGIETSCDETAVAIVTDTGEIKASLVLSQIAEHAVFGGVVPEIAARAHLDHLDTLISGALSDSGLSLPEVDGFAATCGPGLIGGVMIGMMAGKALAASQGKPFIAVNHLEAHALTPRLGEDIPFPYLLLLVSGGHSQILVVEDVGSYRRLGTTLDDAAGECFDKCAKIMGLPYPGGPNVEIIARNCPDPEAARARFPLPRPMTGRPGYDFSFSGLKTAVRAHVGKLPEGELKAEDISQLACALQEAIAFALIDRCENAVQDFQARYGKGAFVVSGGVAANAAIRRSLRDLTERYEMSFHAPPIQLCSDNGVMVAWTGIERLRRGMTSHLDFAARPRWPLDPDAEPRHGAGVKA